MLFIASAIWYNWEKQMERWGALFDREGGERAVCGQYALWLDNPLAAQIIDRLNRKSARPFEQGDQRPGMLCPVEHLSDNRLEINWMRWGFPSPTGGALIKMCIRDRQKSGRTHPVDAVLRRHPDLHPGRAAGRADYPAAGHPIHLNLLRGPFDRAHCGKKSFIKYRRPEDIRAALGSIHRRNLSLWS